MTAAVLPEQLIFIQIGKRILRQKNTADPLRCFLLDIFSVFLYNYTREKKIEKALTKTVGCNTKFQRAGIGGRPVQVSYS